MRFLTQRRQFRDLSQQEILALAISSEEDDARIYRSYAEMLRPDFPDTAQVFDGMAREEDGHRKSLIDLHRTRFGDVIPLIRREHVAGYYARKPVWLIKNLGIERIRDEAEAMERDAERFYLEAAKRTSDAATRKLLGDLASAEAGHQNRAGTLMSEHLDPDARDFEDRSAHRQFVLTWVQPGLAGLMDGSVSTLAPIFATAFATQDTWTRPFWSGWRPASARASRWASPRPRPTTANFRAADRPSSAASPPGVMTALGGLGHALPYLIPHFWTATSIAFVVVFIELWAIAWIQNRYMDTPFFRAAFQVVLGGALVFAAGVLIGSG